MDDKNLKDKDRAILLDCDLAILGAAPARFVPMRTPVLSNSDRIGSKPPRAMVLPAEFTPPAYDQLRKVTKPDAQAIL